MQLFRLRTFNSERAPGQKLIDVYVASKDLPSALQVLHNEFSVSESDPMLSDAIVPSTHFLFPVKKIADLKLFKISNGFDVYVVAKSLRGVKSRLSKSVFEVDGAKISEVRKPFIF